ncbi:MAG: O-methyltransferase [Nitrososphaerota archaeon]
MNKKIQTVLNKLQKQSEYETKYEHTIPHAKRMLAISKDIGLFYNILLKAIEAQKILEIGTSTGYSTMWFADAVLANTKKSKTKGVIITIDGDPSKIKRSKKNFKDAGITCVEIRKGTAKAVLSKMLANPKNKEFFDFIFIDADKESYIEYFEMCLPMVRQGGIIGADNILLPARYNKFTKKYVAHVRKNPSVQSMTIPIDNGEEITIKLS